jgi:hypothetical protein
VVSVFKRSVSLGYLLLVACDGTSGDDEPTPSAIQPAEDEPIVEERVFELAAPELVLQEMYSIEGPLVQGRVLPSEARIGIAGDGAAQSGFHSTRVRLYG